ncbi:winged helix DNA-binding domain-containing protein [Pseudoxanthomonas wuyuanensis]
MTPLQLTATRLHRQGIARPLAATVTDTIARLGAVQAQDYHAALWAVGLRTAGATEADVEAAIAGGQIVRTWPMRGTLHLVAATDVRWMLSLTAARTMALDAARQQREYGLDEQLAGRCAQMLARALEGGRCLTRSALYDVLEAAGIATGQQRGLQILGRLAQQGVLCQGPREGRQPTFTLLHEWAPQARELPREQALAELAQRYFHSRGPATVQDFAGWSGLTVTDARRGLQAVAQQLQKTSLEGRDYWFAADAESHTPAAVHLLPAFDEYLIAYKDRSAALDLAHARQVIGVNGLYSPVVVINGRVAATWKRAIDKDPVALELRPLRALNKTALRAIESCARRYGQFLGRTVRLDD